MLQTFLPLFVMTFGICLFIVLMQFLWRYIDDMVGKGLSIPILGEMFFYAGLSLFPLALPLSILLSSLMTFGNLGERLELLAMKSAGVSLEHIMRPLVITIAFISVGAFFFQNNVMPVAQVKLYSLLYSIRQKSPELDIPEGVFYRDITGFNVYVKKKEKSGLLRDVMIYDYSKGFNRTSVIVADSGRLKTSADKMFLVLSLSGGEAFENIEDGGGSGKKTYVPYQRESFSTKEILIEFDANFSRTDESLLANQYIGKKLNDLQTYIDSMDVRLDSIKAINAKSVYDMSYRKTFSPVKKEAESDAAAVLAEETADLPAEKAVKPAGTVDFDSLYLAKPAGEQAALLVRAKSSAESVKADYYFKAATQGDEAYKLRRHKTEWHKKFTLSFACMVFFFIGAPLGAIIRKGGLGVPVVISVILFIFYYIVDNIGFKMARDGIWQAWEGMWLSSAVLAPLGVFLTYKAVNDSVILNPDTYIDAVKHFISHIGSRKRARMNQSFEN